MNEYRFLCKKIKKHLNCKTLNPTKNKLQKLIDKELEKPSDEMDRYLIELCLNALVAHNQMPEKSETENQP